MLCFILPLRLLVGHHQNQNFTKACASSKLPVRCFFLPLSPISPSAPNDIFSSSVIYGTETIPTWGLKWVRAKGSKMGPPPFQTPTTACTKAPPISDHHKLRGCHIPPVKPSAAPAFGGTVTALLAPTSTSKNKNFRGRNPAQAQ